jgi:hypothetical protein
LIRAAAADALKLTFLQDAEQRNLHIGGDVANFIEENRSAIGQLETAKMSLCGSCERSFLMTEEL